VLGLPKLEVLFFILKIICVECFKKMIGELFLQGCAAEGIYTFYQSLAGYAFRVG
jgi:hypothetical protein